MAQAGAQVVLVDFASAPLALSRQAFLERGVAGEFVQADVRAMPLPAGRFDLTWNAGVLEHADPDAQAAMLREMARVTRPGGQVVTVNPHARCVPYQLGKHWALRTGRWPYGDERPLFSHRQLFAAADLALEDEFSIGADVGFDFLRFIPALGPPLREIARAWWSELSCADRRQMPGYLLVGIART
ncbi:MAG: class I SAM-dependent methyltransferase [bacterium]|nr:class I SAM-dependent methyltransferase [bacterium]